MRALAFCVCVLTALAIQPSAKAADYDLRSINPQICNDGDIPFSFAGAYRTDGWFGYTWVVEGWFRVNGHECTKVGKADTTLGLLRDGKPALYIVITYRDSQHKLRYPKFDPEPRGWHKDERPLCVDTDNAFKYSTSDHDDGPDRQCRSGYVSVNGTFETPGAQETTGYNPNGRDPIAIVNPDLRVTIDDTGSSPTSKTEDSKSAASDGGGMSLLAFLVEAMKEHAKEREKLFVDILNDALFGAGAPALLRGACPTGESSACNYLEICTTASFVNGNNWSDKKNADAVQTELRNYLKSHVLHGAHARIKLGETNDLVWAEQTTDGCEDISHSYNFPVHWASGR